MSSCTLEMDLELSTISVPLAAERRGKTRLNILFFFFSFKRFYFNSPVTLLVCIIAELVLI